MNDSDHRTLSAQIHITNDRLVFVTTMLSIICLCAAIYPLRQLFIGRVFAADFGILSNLTLLLLLTSVGRIASDMNNRRNEIQKRLIQNRTAGLKDIAPDLGLILLCVFLCGESLNWLWPFLDSGNNPQTLMTVKDILAAAFKDVPEKIELSQAMAIASARLALVLAPLYLVGFLVLRYQSVMNMLENPEHFDTLTYASAFILLIMLSALIAAFGNNNLEIFEKGSNLSQAVCLTLYLLKTKRPSIKIESP